MREALFLSSILFGALLNSFRVTNFRIWVNRNLQPYGVKLGLLGLDHLKFDLVRFSFPANDG
jgi:hypothetical protein